MGFLPIPTDAAFPESPPAAARPAPATRPTTTSSAIRRYKYDVALSFAGSERLLAEELATILRDKGVEVFYDDFYPEQLWGKDLGSHFDRIYRKYSRFCVIFASNEYKNRIWPNAERRSAVARSIVSTGTEYILPILVENVDLDGIPPTIGHVDVRQVPVSQIAELLLRKLASSA